MHTLSLYKREYASLENPHLMASGRLFTPYSVSFFLLNILVYNSRGKKKKLFPGYGMRLSYFYSIKYQFDFNVVNIAQLGIHMSRVRFVHFLLVFVPYEIVQAVSQIRSSIALCLIQPYDNSYISFRTLTFTRTNKKKGFKS